MTQKELILEYTKEYGSILPAKLYGSIYKEGMFGSETSKRCREMRKAGNLRSVPEGRFERFYLAEAPVFKPEVEPKQGQMLDTFKRF